MIRPGEKMGKTLDAASAADFDAILEVVGPFGRYQIMVASVTALAFYPNCMAVLLAIFTASTPEHWCSVPELSHLSPDQQQRLVSPPGEYGGYDVCRMYDVSNYSLLLGDFNVSSLDGEEYIVPETKDCEAFSYDTSFYTRTIATQVGIYL